MDPLFRIFGKAAVQLCGNDSAYIAITSAIDNVFYGFTQRAIKAAHQKLVTAIGSRNSRSITVHLRFAA